VASGFYRLIAGPRAPNKRAKSPNFVPCGLQFFASDVVEPLFPGANCLSSGALIAPIEAQAEANLNRGHVMLGWVVTFLIIALVAGILGFGGIAGASIEIAKIIFFIAIVLFLVSAVVSVSRGRRV
jgi:uncharacterized membrane protein YtjA (UPF0391 family)